MEMVSSLLALVVVVVVVEELGELGELEELEELEGLEVEVEVKVFGVIDAVSTLPDRVK